MKKFKLWDSNNVVYGYFDNQEDVYKAIQNYTETKKIEVYYYRQSINEEAVTWVDYGSHNHFFYFKEIEIN